jgi:hypothetical protein
LVRFAEWPSIRALHCLGGGVWCGALLLQLATAPGGAGGGRGRGSASSSARRPQQLSRRLHRAGGAAMLAAAAAVGAGYAIMEAGGAGVAPAHVHGVLVAWTFYRPVAAWFALTAVAAGVAARRAAALGAAAARPAGRAKPEEAAAAAAADEAAAARRRHAAWALRHAAAGLAFGLARALVLAVGFALHATGAADLAAGGPARARCFYACAYAAGALAVGGAELALRRRRRRSGG